MKKAVLSRLHMENVPLVELLFFIFAKKTEMQALLYRMQEMLSVMIGAKKLVFLYDATGRREGFLWYTGTQNHGVYSYVYNLQGDVVGIVDGNMNLVVSYEYDSWGRLVSQEPAEGNVGHLNPFRYRGYCYDVETGLYYLGSRYYDPEVGRFVNADGYVYTGTGILGHNMYLYCNNSVVNMVDYTEEVPDHILLANAEKYANGANILMCGYGNNVKRVTNNLSSDVGMANMAASMGAEVGLSIARNSYETAKKPNNIGIGTNKKNTDLILKEIDQVSECVDDIFQC